MRVSPSVVVVVVLLLLQRVEASSSSSSASLIAMDPHLETPSSPPALGHAMLPYFQLGEGFLNFNHGSFGSCPRTVIQQQRNYTDQMEAYPDIWFRKTYRDLIMDVRKALADYVHADEEGLVLVENASSGVNSVLRALELQKGDTVLYLSTAYSMVINTLEYLKQREGISLLQVQVTFPATFQSIVTAVESAIVEYEKNNTDGGKIRLAIFSHITSVPSIILPIEGLTSVCHEHGIQVMIDGAHALGSIPLNLRALNVDYYAANAHKWLYSPKGTAFLWVSPVLQPTIMPTVISSENQFNATAFSVRYQYTGTRDYTGFCSIPAALDFRKFVGEERILSYLHGMAVEAGRLLAKMWNTEVLVGDDMVGPMVNVRIPSDDSTTVVNLQAKLFDDYKMYIVVYGLDKKFWARLSAQVYLEMNDFKLLGETVMKILTPSV